MGKTVYWERRVGKEVAKRQGKSFRERKEIGGRLLKGGVGNGLHKGGGILRLWARKGDHKAARQGAVPGESASDE